MGLLSGKCPECGASLKINDQAKGELTCPYCGSPYIVEKALNITNITNNVTNNVTTNVQAENVNINTSEYATFKICVVRNFYYRGKHTAGSSYALNLSSNGEDYGNLNPYEIIEVSLDISKQNTIKISNGSFGTSLFIIKKGETKREIEITCVDDRKYQFELVDKINMLKAQANKDYEKKDIDGIFWKPIIITVVIMVLLVTLFLIFALS